MQSAAAVACVDHFVSDSNKRASAVVAMRRVGEDMNSDANDCCVNCEGVVHRPAVPSAESKAGAPKGRLGRILWVGFSPERCTELTFTVRRARPGPRCGASLWPHCLLGRWTRLPESDG
eukprot:64609-Chlamydomonas_euryale.AAC.3